MRVGRAAALDGDQRRFSSSVRGAGAAVADLELAVLARGPCRSA